MIRLNKTIRKLQLSTDTTVSGGAGVVVSFIDTNPSNDDTRGGTQLTSVAGPGDTDICAAPQQNYVRNIDSVSVYNADSGAHVVTVKIDESATDTIIVKHSLSAAQSLIYEHNTGWSVL